MAQRVHTLPTDDVDGSAATETLRFALDGVEYEIDLNEQHARELRESVAPFTRVARHVGGGRARGRARRGETPSAPGPSGSGQRRTATR